MDLDGGKRKPKYLYLNIFLFGSSTIHVCVVSKMAASLQTNKLIPLLSSLKLSPLLPVTSVRFKSVGLIRRRKKPIQKWFDPADKSWAEPILRYQEKKDLEPEPQPSMLHMVYRVKDHFTHPWWEKDMLKELGLFEKLYNPVVLKNTPEINRKLDKIKHLVRIKPVTFPYGLPKDESDYKYCFLNEKGEFIVRHRIHDQSDEFEQAWAEVKLKEERTKGEDIWEMDKETIMKDTRKILQRYELSAEYFKEKYIYRYNQDGKEHRYKGEEGANSMRQDWH